MKAPRQLLATIVEAAPFAILVVDVQGRIVFANRGATLLFGYAHDALVGMRVDTLVPAGLRERHRAHRERFGQQLTERPMAAGRALSAQRADGTEVPVEVALKPLADASAAHVLAVVVDITERRHLEQKVLQAQEELERRIEERTRQLERATAEKERLLRDLQAKSRDLERLSLEDPLTGLSNRRDLDRRIAEWIGHAQRTATPLTVALFDIDYFKRVNDRYGHATGDAVLKRTADLLRRECRTIDVVARYGGEEFAIVFPEVGIEEGTAICQRIRHAYEQTEWSDLAPESSLTISAGLACWHTGMDGQALLEASDQAMYEAKRQGRNRVVA
jgi:diguanylate cyclase (GGDEF)-like protein/PAS domain S-box-containing protein